MFASPTEPTSWKSSSSKYESYSREAISKKKTARRTAASVASDRGRVWHVSRWTRNTNMLLARDVSTEKTIAGSRSISRHSHALDQVLRSKVSSHTIAKHDVTLSWCEHSIHLIVQVFILWLLFHKINVLQCCCGDVRSYAPSLSGVSSQRRETEERHDVSAPDLQNTILSPSITVGVN